MGQVQSNYNTNLEALISTLQSAQLDASQTFKEQIHSLLESVKKQVDILPDSITDLVALISIVFGSATAIVLYCQYKKISQLAETSEADQRFVRDKLLSTQLEGLRKSQKNHPISEV